MAAVQRVGGRPVPAADAARHPPAGGPLRGETAFALGDRTGGRIRLRHGVRKLSGGPPAPRPARLRMGSDGGGDYRDPGPGRRLPPDRPALDRSGGGRHRNEPPVGGPSSADRAGGRGDPRDGPLPRAAADFAEGARRPQYRRDPPNADGDPVVSFVQRDRGGGGDP